MKKIIEDINHTGGYKDERALFRSQAQRFLAGQPDMDDLPYAANRIDVEKKMRYMFFLLHFKRFWLSDKERIFSGFENIIMMPDSYGQLIDDVEKTYCEWLYANKTSPQFEEYVRLIEHSGSYTSPGHHIRSGFSGLLLFANRMIFDIGSSEKSATTSAQQILGALNTMMSMHMSSFVALENICTASRQTVFHAQDGKVTLSTEVVNALLANALQPPVGAPANTHSRILLGCPLRLVAPDALNKLFVLCFVESVNTTGKP